MELFYNRLETGITPQLNSHCISINNLYKTKECPRGEIGRHKGLENLSASKETLKVELRKFGGGLTVNTEPS